MSKKAFILFLLIVPFFAHGQIHSVVINEIAWMGTQVEGVDQNQWWRYEWVELHNVSGVSVLLDGWSIELSRESLDFSIPLAGSIEPNGYFLAGASAKIKGVDLNYKNLAGKFNNSGQLVVLKNSAGEIVDQVDARLGWLEGDNTTKTTMERDIDFTAWHTSSMEGGTPKTQNTIVQASAPLETIGTSKPNLGKQNVEPIVLVADTSSSSKNNPLFVAIPSSLLVAGLALTAKRLLWKRRFDPAQR